MCRMLARMPIFTIRTQKISTSCLYWFFSLPYMLCLQCMLLQKTTVALSFVYIISRFLFEFWLFIISQSFAGLPMVTTAKARTYRQQLASENRFLTLILSPIPCLTDDDSDADLVTDYLDAPTLLNNTKTTTTTATSPTANNNSTDNNKFNNTTSSTTPNIKNYFVSTVDIKEKNNHFMSGAGGEHHAYANGTQQQSSSGGGGGGASNGHFHHPTAAVNINSINNNTITITTPSGHTTNNNILINNHHINNINCVNASMVPIISVTPHSPGAKYNSILEDSLSHLQSIRETVQQMKNSSGQNASFVSMGIVNPTLAASKVFHSCPSLTNLSVSNAIWLAAQNAMTYTLNDNRRKSWTAIEDLTDCTKNSHKRYIIVRCSAFLLWPPSRRVPL